MTEPTLTPEDIALEEAKEAAAAQPEPVPGSDDLPDEIPDGPVLSGPGEDSDEHTLPKED